jgi:hypothetical protein
VPRGNIHQAIRNAVAAKGNSVSIVILIVKRLLVFPYPVLFALMLSVLSVQADDWPQWRGLNRDGVWRETGILEVIPASGLAVRWRAKIGQGYSGPVVAQGRVYVTDHQFNPEVERVVCLDETTGKQLWVHSYPTTYKDMEYGNGPRASPTVHDGMVHTLGTQGHLVCLNAASGDLVWKKSLAEDLHGDVPRYGASAAPLVVGDLLIVCAGAQPDASVVALDCKTGELRWKALADRPAYSAPIRDRRGWHSATDRVDRGLDQRFRSNERQDPLAGAVEGIVRSRRRWSPRPSGTRTCCCSSARGIRESKMLKLDRAKPDASVLWETRAKPDTTISTPLFQDDDYFLRGAR